MCTFVIEYSVQIRSWLYEKRDEVDLKSTSDSLGRTYHGLFCFLRVDQALFAAVAAQLHMELKWVLVAVISKPGSVCSRSDGTIPYSIGRYTAGL
jgi:hypothetical protein